MEKKILKKKCFLKKNIFCFFFKKMFFFRIFFSMTKNILFFEILFFEKIKLCTVDSATFYTNPTKTSLQKMVEKKVFFDHFSTYFSKSLWIEGPRCHKTHKKYQVNSDYLSTFFSKKH